jgi:hypothetical protein
MCGGGHSTRKRISPVQRPHHAEDDEWWFFLSTELKGVIGDGSVFLSPAKLFSNQLSRQWLASLPPLHALSEVRLSITICFRSASPRAKAVDQRWDSPAMALIAERQPWLMALVLDSPHLPLRNCEFCQYSRLFGRAIGISDSLRC